MSSSMIEVRRLRHVYGDRVALDDVSFSVQRGEVFGLLGPNGGGKTTLFKILATLMRPSSGEGSIAGDSITTNPAGVRRHLGVVFQHPSLDGKLTVFENLMCHGHLYGMSGAQLRSRIEEMLQRVRIDDRKADLVETLSGGLQRRVELAKALLHAPPVLLLDEPSTGLDPGARRDFLQYLRELRERDGVTVILTTHYMDEAERCDRVAILHRGKLASIGAPIELKNQVGGDVVVLQSGDPEGLRQRIEERFQTAASVVDGTVRIERPRGHEFVRDVVDAFPADISFVTYGKPTLEDVFIHLTGHQFWTDSSAPAA